MKRFLCLFSVICVLALSSGAAFAAADFGVTADLLFGQLEQNLAKMGVTDLGGHDITFQPPRTVSGKDGKLYYNVTPDQSPKTLASCELNPKSRNVRRIRVTIDLDMKNLSPKEANQQSFYHGLFTGYFVSVLSGNPEETRKAMDVYNELCMSIRDNMNEKRDVQLSKMGVTFLFSQDGRTLHMLAEVYPR